MSSCLIAVLFAWSLFGNSASGPSAEEAAKAAQESASKAAQAVAAKTAREIIEQSVKEAAERAAADAAAAREAKEHAEKLRVEAREDAAKERAEARADAEKAKAEREELRKQIDTRIFRLRHASAEEVAACFNQMWSGDFGVNWKVTKMAVAFPESNSVMVTAPRLILDACEKSISELDVEAQQVYIEARFVELGNVASHKVGIDWTMLDGMSGTATLGGGIQSYNVGRGVTGYTRSITTKNDGTTMFSVSGSDSKDTAGNTLMGSRDGSISYFNGTLNFSQMALTLRLLDSTEDAKTFSNPKIIVSSGKRATVDMTTKYPNVKVSAKRTTNTGGDSLDIAANMEAIPGEDKFMFAREAFFSWGVSLEVTPRIGTNGLINVSIVPTISSREDWVETGTSSANDDGTISSRYPVIKVQRLVSEFNLASGTTAVIGGLSITDERQVDNGIPVLRDIPWIGPRWFGSIVREKVQKEIVVFVTVGLVDPRAMQENAGLPKNAVLGRQYVKGQKLEPGDRPEKNMEGIDSLDMRLLEEQAKEPLPPERVESKFYLPFSKDNNKKEEK